MPNLTIPLALLSVAALSFGASRAPTWIATIKASDGTQLTGLARVEAMGADSSRASIEVSGAKAGSVLPWHIHKGGCGAKGTIMADAKAYPPIMVGPDGSGSSRATLAAQPTTPSGYAVQVHRSATEMTPIACGALEVAARAYPAPPPPRP